MRITLVQDPSYYDIRLYNHGAIKIIPSNMVLH